MSETAEDTVPPVTLDALFQHNVAARPNATAIIEAPGAGATQANHVLTYRAADAAISHIAAQIENFGLPKRSRVALLLPNGVELALSLLAVMRAGHVAAPMPVLWREADLVRGLRLAKASALITTAHATFENLPELAANAASEVFELSFPCSFGVGLPDGVVPIALSGTGTFILPGRADDAPAIATFDATADGIAIRQRNDSELLAAGLGSLIAADIRSGEPLVAAISIASLAGIAGAFVPWLLSGGALLLAKDLSNQLPLGPDGRVHIVAPAHVIAAIAGGIRAPVASCIAIHRDNLPRDEDASALAAERIVDLHVFGEIGALAVARPSRAAPAPIPIGKIPAGGGAAPIVVETSLTAEDSILLRGAMVPRDGRAGDVWQATGYSALRLEESAFTVRSAPASIIAIGGLRFGLADLERRILAAAPQARVAAIDDPLLGTRIAIWARDPMETSRALLNAGLPRIIAHAVLQSERTRATG